MINVIGIEHLNIRVANLDRSLRFYGDILGLREIHRSRRPDGSVSLLALRAGDCMLFLQPSPDDTPSQEAKQRDLDHFAVEIERQEPELLAVALREAGVEIVEGPVKRFGAHGHGTSVYVRDPDGHKIELKQYDLGQ